MAIDRCWRMCRCHSKVVFGLPANLQTELRARVVGPFRSARLRKDWDDALGDGARASARTIA
jgi:hypothetical protein